MKHFALNQQETNRDSESSEADDKTKFELYYPPFDAGVEAGASAAMCSYNKERGTYSCSNEETLSKHLKGAMGFKGFVQSDWGAAHGNTVEAGLDMDMPMVDDGLFHPQDLAGLPTAATDDAARRVLAVMYRHELFNTTKCAPPGCESFFRAQVSTRKHKDLARRAATDSIVLLQNKGAVLPFDAAKVKTIAVVGGAAVGAIYNPLHGQWFIGDYYSGGGSGHVTAGSVVTPLDGIKAAAAAKGIQVVASVTDDVGAATSAAAQADVTVVVAATTSGESVDRSSLALDNNADALISAVAAAAKKTVVLVQAPGSFTTPWRDAVDAAAALFLGGEQTGAAWGSVLFGDVAPSGRLPVQLPASEADTIAPSGDGSIPYSEGMATSYRNTQVTAAFPFGHGLTFAAFNFSSAAQVPCGSGGGAACVKLSVTNAGGACARAVPQLYARFPSAAKHPSPLLKGFVKTDALCAGTSADVTFRLTTRDVSYYDAGEWVVAPSLTALIGASAADVQLQLPISPAVPVSAA